MFIAGVPGTGKTATVLRVFQDITKDKELSPMMNKIKTIEINGLKLSDPNQFYSHFQLVSSIVILQPLINLKSPSNP